MNTSIKTRLAALVASILVTFITVDFIAAYALPEVPPVLVASAVH
jgi:hypothetical protein